MSGEIPEWPLIKREMQTVNIRQLKTNPSTVLAAARADDIVVVMNRLYE
jgi:hypothetical protein